MISLKSARVKSGLTQKEASKILKISAATLRRYEHGKAFPSVEMIESMEKLYDISYNDIDFLSNEKTV